ncbi:hypothetical protein GWE18_15070 [Bradyrhizobium sp. CSA112]|uniref:hypothetical protein n=1 Tax=Bradyrhizobium sp. CSA112 TaxID=2699170 RepID=UPI0023B191F5|nr:hypothetical protein [Bradyrhizobium sp. CSA112]MDE5454148.1 hypothetical protein [Bradyrhizobium sp. CSA112]
MVWVIIGCTILIIVCLGGGKRLAQILLGAVALIGFVVVAFASDVGIITTSVVVLTIIGFFLLMTRARRERRG